MTERRSYLFLMGLILAALIGVGLLAIPGSPIQRSPTLGLDLQGDLEPGTPPVTQQNPIARDAILDRKSVV